MMLFSIHNTQYGKQLIFYLTLFTTGVLTLTRSIRFPNDWSMIHWLINYQFGFVKRGLLGTLLAGLGFYQTDQSAYNTIVILSFVLLGVLFLALTAVCIRIMMQTGWHRSGLFFSIVFMSSPFMVMIGHLTGYLDHIFQLFTLFIVVLVIKRFYTAAILLQIIAILVHESYLVVGFPAVFLCMVLQFMTESTHQRIRLRLAVVTVPLFTFLLVALFQEHIDPTFYQVALRDYLQNFRFLSPASIEYFPTLLVKSFWENWVQHSPDFWSRILDPTYLLIIVPTLFFALRWSQQIFVSRLTWYLRLLVGGVAVSPLALHAIAWDTSRVWTYSIFAAFIIVWILSEFYPAEESRYSPDASLFFLTLLINSYSRLPLMDGVVDRGEAERTLIWIIILGLIVLATSNMQHMLSKMRFVKFMEKII